MVVFPVITGSSGRERIYDGYPDVALEMISSRTFDGRIQLPMSGSASSNSEAGGCVVWYRERNWSSMIRYMIGPDVAMQLVYDEAVIRAEH